MWLNEAQTAALLAAFQMRGVKVDELIGFRDALLSGLCSRRLAEFHPIDIVGTGGDGKNTFNISTCACFVVAGAGYPGSQARQLRSHFRQRSQQRHGTLRRQIYKTRQKLKRSMEECGMTYLHAPLFNPALKTVAPVRKALRTYPVQFIRSLVKPCPRPSSC